MPLMAEAFEKLVRGLEDDGMELRDMPLALPMCSSACFSKVRLDDTLPSC